jgi:2-polyprenyl-3-methyl-5-hydroxy-6-metoxy-1,4-benzoquinol methylase
MSAIEKEGSAQLLHAKDRYGREYVYPPCDVARFDAALELIGTGHEVLDVGAFDGQFSARIKERGNRVTALDVSAEALERAKLRGVDIVQADLATTWPFENCSFDVVFAGEIIEHLVDTDAFLTESRRVVRRGGRLVITTPNLASLGRRILLALGRNPYIDTALRTDQAGHVRYFVRSSLKTLLEENGFRIEAMRGDYLGLSGQGFGSARLGKRFGPIAKSIICAATPEQVDG